MDNFNLKKYLAEGKLLKESTLEYLIDKYGQKMIDFTIKVDQLTDGEVNDIEYLEDRIKTHLAWEEWKMGPMTEPGMVPYAKQEILKYLEMQLFARKPIK